jgi:NADPH:quinone reductase-like Zn-dependent oxidoreductase
VIAFGKARGHRIISMVRRPDVVAELEAAGSEVVLVDDEAAPDRIATAVGDERSTWRSTGSAALRRRGWPGLCRPMGTSSPTPFMGDYAAPADLRPLMDKELTLHSFYQVRPQYDAKIPGILAEARTMIVTGELYAPVAATYPLSAIKEAVAHAERGGKVLLDAQKA